jgi:uncharacterized protein with PIN domain
MSNHWYTVCECEQYDKNVKVIDSAIDFLWTHDMGSAKIKPFIFCPYCGKRLKRIDSETKKEWIDPRQISIDFEQI